MMLWWLACTAPEPGAPELVEPTEPWLAQWRDLSELEAWVDWLGTHPGASVEVLGSSVEARPIRALRIRHPEASEGMPGALITSLQHAREWIAGASGMHIAERLVRGTDAQAREVLENWEVVVIPVVNPDGYRHSWTTDRLWRKNRAPSGGVDLNRNWGEGWGKPGSSPDPDNNNFRGPAAFSEPETEAVRGFVLANPHLQVHVDLHSTGQLVLYPWGHTEQPSPADEALAERALRAAADMEEVDGQRYDPGRFHERLYPASGVAVDWTHAQGLESYLFELRDRGQYGFMLDDELRQPAAEEAWAGVRALLE